MTTAYLAFGSNEGDRRDIIGKAVEAVGKLPQTQVEAVSTLIETEAEGFDGPSFLNGCARIRTGLAPQSLLEGVKGIERMLGRRNEGVKLDAEGRRIYASRPIDIDILLYGNENINTETLQIPHPGMKDREFVMIPLKEILK